MGKQINQLTNGISLTGTDILELEQFYSGQWNSHKVSLSTLAAFFGITSLTLASVLSYGSNTGGTSIDVNDGDSIRLGDSRIGVLDYFPGGGYVRLYHSVTNDYLRLKDAGGIDLVSAAALSLTGGTSITLTGTNSVNLVSNSGTIALSTTTNYLSVIEGVGIVSATNSNATGYSISESTNIFRLFASSELRLDASNITFYQLTANTVPYLNGSKQIVSSSITPTELGYLSGSSSNIQNQLNNLAIGIGGWKSAARVMSSSNVTISSPGSTIDGITMASGDRVVLNGQSTGSQNGVYVWNGAASAMTRATDCTTGDSSNTGVLGMVITIEEGTYADQFWVLTNNAPITIGSTSLTYAKGSATTYTGSSGITLTGNNFTLDNSYFTGDATISGGAITIGAGKVTNSMLAGSIAFSKLVGTDITAVGALASGSITTGFTSISTSFTDAKIKGSVSATAGVIPYGTGTADTVTSSTSFWYDGTNFMVGTTSSSGTGVIGDFVRNATATTQVRVTNTSATNGAYVQFTAYHGASYVANFGVVGQSTTTSGVYALGNAYNITNTTGFSMGTTNASGVVRMYGGNGVLCFTVDSSSHFNMADAKNIIFNTSTGTKIGTGTTQKFAFWNKTPIVQPTTGVTGATKVGGGGTNVTDTDTFGGYTIAQLAAVIINTGLAA